MNENSLTYHFFRQMGYEMGKATISRIVVRKYPFDIIFANQSVEEQASFEKIVRKTDSM